MGWGAARAHLAALWGSGAWADARRMPQLGGTMLSPGRVGILVAAQVQTMGYTYEFDDTEVGNFRLSRHKYRTLHEGLRLLRSELETWNARAVDNGARAWPYAQEVKDLSGMIGWGDDQLSSKTRDIEVRGISVGSLRYLKAGALLAMRTREQDQREKGRQGWPDGVLQSFDAELSELRKLADSITHEPSDVLWQVVPRERGESPGMKADTPQWDVFVSHASEDKEDFARALAEKLRARGLKVWFDEFTLTVGDSLRRSIDRGLARSRFGIVVISPAFLRKEWPQKELDGLVAREVEGVKVILPVWHGITMEDIRRYSPMLADRVAAQSSKGVEHVVEELMQAIGRAGPDG